MYANLNRFGRVLAVFKHIVMGLSLRIPRENLCRRLYLFRDFIFL